MPKPDTQPISVRIPADKVERLERLATATDRSRSWHIEQALDAYLDLQSWQVVQITRAMAEMEAGEGIPHEEVRRELQSWGKRPKAKLTG